MFLCCFDGLGKFDRCSNIHRNHTLNVVCGVGQCQQHITVVVVGGGGGGGVGRVADVFVLVAVACGVWVVNEGRWVWWGICGRRIWVCVGGTKVWL